MSDSIIISKGKNEITKLLNLLSREETASASATVEKYSKGKMLEVCQLIERKTKSLYGAVSEEIRKIESEPNGEVADFNISIIQDEGNVLKAGIPHVIMRERTIRTVFAGFYDFFKEKDDVINVSKKFFEIGRIIGRSFAVDLFKMLQKHRVKIEHISDFIDILWSAFDAQGGYGKISLESITEKNISISLKNSFLVSEGEHKFCSWMEGYVYGVLEFSLIELQYFNYYHFKTTVKSEKIRQIVGSGRVCVPNKECLFNYSISNFSQLDSVYKNFYTLKYSNVNDKAKFDLSTNNLFRCINQSIEYLTDGKIKVTQDLLRNLNEFQHVEYVLGKTLACKDIEESLKYLKEISSGINNNSYLNYASNFSEFVVSFYGFLLNIHKIGQDIYKENFVKSYNGRMFKYD